MRRKSATVVAAVTLQRLFDGRVEGFTSDQELCIDALRRSKASLEEASVEELGNYLRTLEPAQLRGVASNVKGIFHEMLVARAENIDGDDLSARLFEQTNMPGADIEFVMDGDVVQEVQLKAVQTLSSITEAIASYPDIDIMVMSEVLESAMTAFPGRVSGSGFENAALAEATDDVLSKLEGEDLSDLFQDGMITSVLVSGALQARSILQDRTMDAAKLRSALETASVGVATTVMLDTLLDAL